VGDIIDRTLRLLRANPVLFLGITILPNLITDVLERAVGLSQTFDLNDLNAALSRPSATPVFPSQLHPVDPVAGSVVGIIAFALSLAQAAAITIAIGQRYLNRPETVPDAYRRGVRSLPRLLLSVLAIGVLFVVAVVVVAIALTILASLGLAAVAVIIGLVGFFFLLPWAFLSVTLVVPAIVIDGLGPIAAIRRSFQLMDKARLRTLGLEVLTVIIIIILSLVFSVIFLVAFVAEPTLRAVLQTVADVASASIGAALLYGVTVILYYDLRVRKEAFDLQLAAEALPREG
jgi:hypothetical protein